MRRLVLVLSLVFTSVLCARRTSLEAKQKVVAAAAATYSYTTAWYNQTLDHFTFTTDAKFRQKYLVNDTWWDRDKVSRVLRLRGAILIRIRLYKLMSRLWRKKTVETPSHRNNWTQRWSDKKCCL